MINQKGDRIFIWERTTNQKRLQYASIPACVAHRSSEHRFESDLMKFSQWRKLKCTTLIQFFFCFLIAGSFRRPGL